MIPVRDDRSAEELRVLARAAATGRETLRLIAIAAILDGRGRRESAGLAGMSQMSLERAVNRYNAEGVDGLRDKPKPGRPSSLTPEQEAELKELILAGPADSKTGRAEFNVRGIITLIMEKFKIRLGREAVRTMLHGMGLVKLVCRPIHHKTDQAAQDKFKEEFPAKIAKITADHPEAAHIEIWVQDETRVGQKGKVVAMWAEKGSSPRAVVHGGFKSAFLFGAFCPERDTGAAIVVESVSTEAMNAHLEVISQHGWRWRFDGVRRRAVAIAPFWAPARDRATRVLDKETKNGQKSVRRKFCFLRVDGKTGRVSKGILSVRQGEPPRRRLSGLAARRR